MSGFQVVSKPGVKPDSEEGRALLVSLLGEAPASAAAAEPMYFPHSIAAGEPTPPHLHTADVAACVTRGRLSVGTGEGFADRVELSPGDYFFIPGQMKHAEEVLGDEPVEFQVAHWMNFHTLEL